MGPCQSGPARLGVKTPRPEESKAGTEVNKPVRGLGRRDGCDRRRGAEWSSSCVW